MTTGVTHKRTYGISRKSNFYVLYFFVPFFRVTVLHFSNCLGLDLYWVYNLDDLFLKYYYTNNTIS